MESPEVLKKDLQPEGQGHQPPQIARRRKRDHGHVARFVKRAKRVQRRVYMALAMMLVLSSMAITQYKSTAKGIGNSSLAMLDSDDVRADLLKDILDEVKQEQMVSERVTEDTLWLARVIYSETKRPHEQELVAWVVRNRVESNYRGKGTFKEVVLDPWQFSAFNNNSPARSRYVALGPESTAAGWQTALRIAQHVINADESERPFSPETWHFYSEQSMVGRTAPAWAAGKQPVPIKDREVEARRFRFYERIV